MKYALCIIALFVPLGFVLAGCGNARNAKILFYRSALYPTDGVRIVAVTDLVHADAPEAAEFARSMKNALIEALRGSEGVQVVSAADLNQAVSTYAAQLVVGGECAVEITRSPLPGDNRFSCSMSAWLSGVRVVGAQLEPGRGLQWFRENYVHSAVLNSLNVPDTLDREQPFQDACREIAADIVQKMARVPEERMVYFSQGEPGAIDLLRAGKYLQCYDLLKEKQSRMRLPAEDYYLLGVACEAIGTLESLQKAQEYYLVSVHERPWESRYARALARLELGATAVKVRGGENVSLCRKLSPRCVPLREGSKILLSRLDCIGSEWIGALHEHGGWKPIEQLAIEQSVCEKILRNALENDIRQNLPFQLCHHEVLEGTSFEKVSAIERTAGIRSSGAEYVLAGTFFMSGDTAACVEDRCALKSCSASVNFVLYDANTLEIVRKFSLVCEAFDDQCAASLLLAHSVLSEVSQRIVSRMQLEYEDFVFRLPKGLDVVAGALLGAGLWDAAEKRLLWANRQRQSQALDATSDPEGEAALAYSMGLVNEGRGAGCYAEALAFYRTAYELQPEQDEYLDALGRIEQAMEHLGVLHRMRSKEEQR